MKTLLIRPTNIMKNIKINKNKPTVAQNVMNSSLKTLFPTVDLQQFSEGNNELQLFCL